MRSLRLITWNCNHGALGRRLAELAPHAPDIAFLQECKPGDALPLVGQFIAHRVNSSKGIALGSLSSEYATKALDRRPGAGTAFLAAAVSGPISFTLLGIWGQKPDYAKDVSRALDAYEDVLRPGQSIVMGDLNSGTNLKKAQPPSKAHSRILARLEGLGLVSAYHIRHNVQHGHETHPTYRHLRHANKPWHIDFCFVPTDWAQNLVNVELMDGHEWSWRSDHLPLKVDLQFPMSKRNRRPGPLALPARPAFQFNVKTKR